MTTTSISDPLVGVLLDGRYQILQRLARGGMATVYRATDMRLSRTVAVKVLHEGLGADEDFIRKFDREARSAARLSHPNVVSVFDQGHDADRPYIVMEYIAGCTLRNLITREAPMAPAYALELIDEVLAALGAAHENGLVHRDIKPENVLVSERGTLKVADFGLARAVSSQTATATQGILIGTVSYLPPELVLHGKADTRSDVYSAGVVLFELLTGTKPYTGETPIQVAYAHVHNQVPPPSSRLEHSWQTSREGIPPYLDALVRAATQREPDRRPTDARAFQIMVRKALQALTAGVMDDPALTSEFSRGFADLENTEGYSYSFDDDENDEGAAGDVRSPPHSPMSASGSPVSPPTVRQRALLRTPAEARELPLPRKHARSPEPRPRMRLPVTVRRRRLLALIVLVLFTIGGLGLWWVLEGRYIATPGVVGQTRANAEHSARSQGLGVDVNEAFSETVPVGVVISTDPTAGADITRGGTITTVVSKGPERFMMPRVQGLSRDDATRALAESSLAVGTVTEDWDDERPPGLVTKASVEPGTALRRGDQVNLTLSKGPRPIKIPDVGGKPAAEAQGTLERAGFAVVVKTANSSSVPAGAVVSQEPADGVGRRGDTITIVRSLGPVMVKVPEVKAMPTKQASETLAKAGFKVETKREDNHLGIGYASRTDPPAGSMAPQGSTITLFEV